MARPPTLKEFGKRLRRFIRTEEVFGLLKEGDWGAGGCWTLAEALEEYLGPPARLMVISEGRPGEDGEELYVPVSHVVVQYADIYIDHNGAQTEKELFASLFEEGYESPELVEFTAGMRDLAGRSDVACDPWAKRELLKHLRKRFG